MQKTHLILTIFAVLLTTNNTHGNELGMVLIPAGEFNIGKSTKAIYLEDYYIDKTEVTQKNFKEVMGSAIFFSKEKTIPRNR